MADEDDLKPVSIEIPEEDAPNTGDIPKEQPKADDHEAALAELRAQIEAHKQNEARERAAREEAERRARENADKASRAETDAQDGRLTAIQNAIRTQQVEAESAERAYAEALQNGDYAQAAKSQRLMAAAEAKLLQLENGKAALEERAEVAKTQRPEPVQRTAAADPVEEIAGSLTPQSASWLRAHGDAIRSDPSMLRKIGAAHNAAVDLEGLSPDTPDYFAYIEGKLGVGGQKETRQADPPRQQQTQRKQVAAVPVSTGAATTSRGSSNTVTLSPEMREMAHNLYPDLSSSDAEREYAKARVAMIREGRLQG